MAQSRMSGNWPHLSTFICVIGIALCAAKNIPIRHRRHDILSPSKLVPPKAGDFERQDFAVQLVAGDLKYPPPPTSHGISKRSSYDYRTEATGCSVSEEDSNVIKIGFISSFVVGHGIGTQIAGAIPLAVDMVNK